MLKSLHIENAAVIKSADLDFEKGFMVLSGETGAGKSIIIDSINLLSGGRVSREMIRTGEDKLSVSALFVDCGKSVVDLLSDFDIECDGSVMISRSLTRDGKSTVKINGRSVTQTFQKDLCRLLINIHGQNENQRLMQKSAQIEILDAYAENGDLLAGYGEAYRLFRERKSELDHFESDSAEALRMQDMLKYQVAEIDAVKPKVGEEEGLEADKKRLGSIEKINNQIHLAHHALYGSEKSASVLLERAAIALEKIGDVVPECGEFAAKLSEFRYEVDDIADTIRGYTDEDGNPTERLNKIEERLDALTKLKRKYGPEISDVLEFRRKAAAKLGAIENSDEAKKDIERALKEAENKAKSFADTLHARRVEAAGKIMHNVQETLAFLDMPKVRFSIEVEKASALSSSGADDIEFLIAPNAGEPLMPLEKIASGGELSRIMLALRSVLSDKDGVETVIFDEVDAGISGKTSRKVGIKLKEISGGTQVICVTHSAQIASMADEHFLISKHDVDGRTQTFVSTLDMHGRVEEIARILGGIEVTEVQRTAALEMIEEGKAYSHE